MSRELPTKLPDPLVEEILREAPRFNAVPLVCVDAEGFPHVSLLSYFELLYINHRLYFFINSYSRSARYLRARRSCTMIFIQTGFVYYLKGHAVRIGAADSQVIFEMKLDSVLEDFPTTEEGTARLETGIRFDTGREEAEKRARFKKKVSEMLQPRGRPLARA